MAILIEGGSKDKSTNDGSLQPLTEEQVDAYNEAAVRLGGDSGVQLDDVVFEAAIILTIEGQKVPEETVEKGPIYNPDLPYTGTGGDAVGSGG